MRRHFRKSAGLGVVALVILSLTSGTLMAHEGRPVDDYNFVVGWLEEPAYEGGGNAVSVTITKSVSSEAMEDNSPSSHEGGEDGGHGHDHNGEGHHEDSDSHHEEGVGGDSEHGESSSSIAPQGAAKPMASMAMQHHGTMAPVEGLEGSIQVEVTHVAGRIKRVMDLIAVFGEPGHYVAHLIPTVSGVYEFRVFGVIEGTAIDETFVSMGGGGDFDDIQTSAGLHFPEELPEIREIESGVRGALQTAQDAQDAALAAQEQGSGNALAVVALIVGGVGVVLGIGGVFFGMSARKSSQ